MKTDSQLAKEAVEEWNKYLNALEWDDQGLRYRSSNADLDWQTADVICKALELLASRDEYRLTEAEPFSDLGSKLTDQHRAALGMMKKME